MNFRKDEAANRPKLEFVPKTLADLHVEGLIDTMNGGNTFMHGKTDITTTNNTIFIYLLFFFNNINKNPLIKSD